MITCKSVSKALARGDYEKLSPLRRKMLRLHVRLCGMCRNYNGFVMTMQDTAREYNEHEEALAEGEKLPSDVADRIKATARDTLPGNR
jgi:aerobic-type carbon monoxide dehydrogenase small subunit (CoxS/CutS family)